MCVRMLGVGFRRRVIDETELRSERPCQIMVILTLAHHVLFYQLRKLCNFDLIP